MTSPPRTTHPRRSKTTHTVTAETTPTVTADLPGFSLPSQSPLPSPAAATLPPILEDDAAGSPFAGHDVPVPPSMEGSSSPASTDRAGKAPAPVRPADPTLYVELFSTAFAGVGIVLHQRIAPGDDHDAFIPDEQDTASVVTPLASIAARRSPLVGGAANDVTDGLAAAIGAVGYVIKSITKWREAQRRRRDVSGWAEQVHTGGQPAAHSDTPDPAPHVIFDPGASPLTGLGTHVEG